ncbi:MAG: hypothetical protein N3A38_03920 [Planctomycetota bacterium]|nr:hypothetical protein [Planctomycetota bacterium]
MSVADCRPPVLPESSGRVLAGFSARFRSLRDRIWRAGGVGRGIVRTRGPGAVVRRGLPVGRGKAPREDMADLPEYREIIARLAEMRRRWRVRAAASGACAFVAILSVSMLIYAAAEHWLRMPGTVRALIFYAGVTGTILLAVRKILMPAIARISDERAAARVEERFPGLGDAIISSVQLAASDRLSSPALARAAIAQAATAARGVPVEDASGDMGLRRNAAAAGAALAAFLVAWALYGEALRAAMLKLWRTGEFVPSPGEYIIKRVEPGDYGVLAGGEVNIRVTVKPYDGGRPRSRIFVREEGGPEREDALEMGDPTSFLYLLRDVRRSTSYRVEIGRTQSPVFRISVVERPSVRRIAVHVQPPAYTGLPDREETDSSGNLRVPAASSVTMVVTADRPVVEASLLFDDGRRLSMPLSEDKLRGLGKFDVPRAVRYSILLRDANGHANGDSERRTIEVIPDRPPTVRFVEPGRDVSAGMGGKVRLIVQAGDDYGIRTVAVRFRRNREGIEQTLREFEDFGRREKSASREVFLELREENFEKGDTIFYYAEARDHVQSSRTAAFAVRIVDPSREKEEKIEALAEILRRVEMLLNRQLQARSAAGEMAAAKPSPDSGYRGPRADSILKAQAAIRIESLDIAAAIPPGDARQGWIGKDLRKLAADEMTWAQAEAEAIARGAERRPDAASRSLARLVSLQLRIIASLRAILKVLPQVAEDVKEDRREKPGHDLPDEARKLLEGLKDKLADFAREQKKIVEASEDLAKKPVEDLTEADRKKLEELKAVEDKWEKFLKEAYTDLSKLPRQDFADPRLLKELVETYEEVEMAKDALAKKAAEIAVPLEQAGLENAKEMETNIERWLPDEPDRQKWSMEEPIGDNQPPMAELPEELEDIIGDLMEEEEALLEEADDVTSKWADSIDKGAGWDALDGPISNMSARGVTGNHLPNTSEIAGRAGEGRTGKSAGEFVEENFTGKGGRRTPTRLTPDAFQSGEINDTSKDPAGGSTGGGKVSGAGGEGLEGPVPPEIARQMERLAGRQAALRNRAERIAASLRLMNHPSADLIKTVEHVKSLESAMKDGRYQTISREREVVLKGLAAGRRFVEGVAAINRERAVPMPRQLHDEILDAVSGETAVKGYEDLLKAYYESLFQGSGK